MSRRKLYSNGKPRFIQIRGISLEADPQKFTLYAKNTDVPGYDGVTRVVIGN